MKEKVLFIFISTCMLITSIHIHAGAIQEANQQLRSIFSNLHRPSSTVRIFYDMAAHRVDSTFYDIMCADTTSCDTWYYLYDEIYNSAYDTTTFLTPKSVLNYAQAKWVDTLCLGMIDLQYAYLLPEALTSEEYFKFDLENNVLHDPLELTFENGPYGLGEVFMTAPLLKMSETLNPTFVISPATIFWDDSTRVENMEDLECRINLGDGMGWHYINPLQQNYLEAIYPSQGTYYITTEFVKNDGTIIKHSISSIYVSGTKDYQNIDYQECMDVPEGLRVFEIAPNCRYDHNDKYIFILAGYNPMSFVNHGVRSFNKLYEKYVDHGNHEILLDYGYSIVLVDWVDHNDYIQANAMRFVELLEQYKCKQEGDEEFVVIGQSMGCLIGRYALTWMESDKYHPHLDCKREKLHNTRLFISNDGPHQGVNIPLSLQWLYGLVFPEPSFIFAFSDILNEITLGEINFSTTLLKGNSVKQMLYYHYSTENDNEYFPHELHDDFLQDIKNIGNYPKYCKLVALSNGSLEGNPQQQYFSPNKWSPGLFRSENDVLMDAQIYGGFRILGLRFGTGVSMLLRSNPLGSGNLGECEIDIVHPMIRLYLFGIEVRNTTDRYETNQYVNNSFPYCITPGGNEYVDMSIKNMFFNFHIPILGGVYYNSTDNCIDEAGYIGIPWILNFSETFHFCTNGLGFCFVPTVSAFDFKHDNYYDMYTDFVNLDKHELFERTPFDVIIGQYARDTTMRYNENHENIINMFVSQDLSKTSLLYSRDTNDSVVRVLNRIIGDEDLWLNNMIKPWSASYSAEKNIYVNIPEDFLFHENVDSEVDKHVGAYSRNSLFDASEFEIYNFTSSETQEIENFAGNVKLYEGDSGECFEENRTLVHKKNIPQKSNDDNILLDENNDMVISSQTSIQSVEIYSLQGFLLKRYTIEQTETNLIKLPLEKNNIVLVFVQKIDGTSFAKLIAR
jgi:hypothetical protein